MRLPEREDELATLEAVLMDGGVVVVEGGAGIGKTSLLAAAAERAAKLRHDVLRARGSELEASFAFGVVRQLFERRLALASEDERRELLAGPASVAKPVLAGNPAGGAGTDTSFAVLHGLYWLAANFAAIRPLLVAVDDAQWADLPSLHCLAYLAPRVEGLAPSLLIALRPSRPTEEPPPLAAIRAGARLVRPKLLSEAAAADFVRSAAGNQVSLEACAALRQASGGNPFYLTELLRGVESFGSPVENVSEGVTRHVAGRIRRLDPHALRLAQAIAVLGDGCELRHAAALARLEFESGARWPRLSSSWKSWAPTLPLASCIRSCATRWRPPLPGTSGTPPIGPQPASSTAMARHRAVGTHLLAVQSSADPWVVARLREAAADAVDRGAPQVAAALLGRALAEPPPAAERVALLLELGRAELLAGQEAALTHLAQASERRYGGGDAAKSPP